MAEVGLSFESFESSVKDYNLPGDYRRIIVRPSDVEWEIKLYQDPTTDFILSDLEKLKNIPVQSNDEDSGKLRALVIKFSLPSSCYATMALREIMKIETDKSSMMKTSKQEKLGPPCNS